MEQCNIVIVGVGGQGTLLASKILGRLAMDAGLAVKVSEVHGMAQRGGSVITHVRFGQTVLAPLVTPGTADYLLSFEALEGKRYAEYLKKGGALIVNTQRIAPMPVVSGLAAYPADPLEGLAEQCDVLAVPADQLALQAGSIKAVNVVLLGVLAKRLPFTQEQWDNALRVSVPERFYPLNRLAFTLGYENS